MVNTNTGTGRTIDYCGRTYRIEPAAVRGGKQFWQVWEGTTVLAPCVCTLSKAQRAIHQHAVETGAYAAAYTRFAAGEAPLPTLTL